MLRSRRILSAVVAASFCFVSISDGAQAKAKPAVNNESEDQAFIGFDSENKLEEINKSISELFAQGKYEESVALAKSAVELSIKEFGEKHSESARAINNLAWHEQSLGDFVSARRDFERALAIQEQLFGKDDPRLATVINNLGSLLAFQGDYETAKPLLEKSLALEVKVLGDKNPLLAPSMMNLANVVSSLGQTSEALTLTKDAHKLLEDSPQKDQLAYAQALSAMALFQEQEGDLTGAANNLQQALQVKEAKVGSKHPDLTESLINLAMVKAGQRKFDEARANLNRALEISEQSFGPTHVNLAAIWGNLARIDLYAGDGAGAAKKFQKARQLIQEHVKNVFPGLSFAEQRAFVASRIPVAMSGVLSTCDNTNAAECYESLIQWKGLLVEALKRQSRLERLSKDPEVGSSVRDLQTLRTQFAQLFHRAGKLPFSEWSKQTAELIAARESLERKIGSSKQAAGLQDVLSGISVDKFREYLKDGEALVDIYRYERITSAGKSREYAAFIVSPSGQPTPVQFVQLGSADIIERSISQWRIEAIGRKSGQVPWEQLTVCMWQKVQKALPQGTSKVIVCPDAHLSLIPFNLFWQSPDKMLSQLNSPRELAHLRTSAALSADKKTFLLAGGLDFGKPQEGEISVPALPGTLLEAKRVEKLAQAAGYETTLLSGREATRERLTSVIQTADHAHLATHGFFESGGFAMATFKDDRAVTARLRPITQGQKRDPLASSGIILSTPAENAPVEILTAGEMVALNLERCRAITLSACETGLGTAEPGQGVLGLRASLMAAGARCILMSLWKVPDDPTVLLMEEYYRGVLEKKLPPAQSLRLAQEAVKKQGGALENPYHWGAWVLVGESWN